MAMFAHSVSYRSDRPGETHWHRSRTWYESFNQEEEYISRCMPQMILALAILTPYTSLHSQSTNAFNGFALIDQSGNIGKPADCRDQYELLRTYPIIHPKGIRSTWHMLPEGRPYYRKAGKFRDGAVLVKEIF